MGVTGLWKILEPCAETADMTDRTLAIDTSIWIYQYADMPVDKITYLVSMRIIKVLYCGIRPVFVFDGETPETKKQARHVLNTKCDLSRDMDKKVLDNIETHGYNWGEISESSEEDAKKLTMLRKKRKQPMRCNNATADAFSASQIANVRKRHQITRQIRNMRDSTRIQSDWTSYSELRTAEARAETPRTDEPGCQSTEEWRWEDDECSSEEQEHSVAAAENDRHTLHVQNIRTGRKVNGEVHQTIKEVLRAFGIAYIDSPGETDAQCGQMFRMGIIDGVVSEDSDMVVHGVTVYRGFFSRRSGVKMYRNERIREKLGLDQEKLLKLAYLLGCDYWEGVRGVGQKRAMQIIDTDCGDIEYVRHAYCNAAAADVDSIEQNEIDENRLRALLDRNGVDAEQAQDIFLHIQKLTQHHGK